MVVGEQILPLFSRQEWLEGQYHLCFEVYSFMSYETSNKVVKFSSTRSKSDQRAGESPLVRSIWRDLALREWSRRRLRQTRGNLFIRLEALTLSSAPALFLNE